MKRVYLTVLVVIHAVNASAQHAPGDVHTRASIFLRDAGSSTTITRVQERVTGEWKFYAEDGASVAVDEATRRVTFFARGGKAIVRNIRDSQDAITEGRAWALTHGIEAPQTVTVKSHGRGWAVAFDDPEVDGVSSRGLNKLSLMIVPKEGVIAMMHAPQMTYPRPDNIISGAEAAERAVSAANSRLNGSFKVVGQPTLSYSVPLRTRFEWTDPSIQVEPRSRTARLHYNVLLSDRVAVTVDAFTGKIVKGGGLKRERSEVKGLKQTPPTRVSATKHEQARTRSEGSAVALLALSGLGMALGIGRLLKGRK